MPSRIIHYIIGLKIVEAHNYNRNDFILGNLLPDAHNGTLYGNSHSHFRYIINGEYTKLPDIEYARFKRKYSEEFCKSLLLGYYCHLLSDYKWVQQNVPGFPDNLNSDSKEFIALRKILHGDFGAMNSILIKYFNLSPPDNLAVPNNLIIDEVDKGIIPVVLNSLKQDFESRYEGGLAILTTDSILHYIDNTIKFCLENIDEKVHT